MSSIDCRILTNDVLLDLAGRRLPEPEREGISLHLVDCRSCRRRFEEVRGIMGAIERCAQAPSELAVERLDQAVYAGLTRAPTSRRRIVGWGIAAAASVFLSFLVGAFSFPVQESPRGIVVRAEQTAGPAAGVAERAAVRISIPADTIVRATAYDFARRIRNPVPMERPRFGAADMPISPGTLLRGDLNNDGVLDVADRLLARRILISATPPSDLHRLDLNGDGVFDEADVRLLTWEIARAR